MKQALTQAARKVADAEAAAVASMKGLEDSAVLDRLADLGNQPQLRTISAAMIVSGLLMGEEQGRRIARAGLRMLVAHEAATFLKTMIKKRIDRTRPRSADRAGGDHRPAPGKHQAKEKTSFPSGHSAGSAAAARAFAREFPEYAAPAAATAAALALVQIPRCAHYPTDVAAGVTLGLAAEAAVAALWPARPPSASGRQEEELELSLA